MTQPNTQQGEKREVTPRESKMPRLCWWCNKKFRSGHYFNIYHDRAWRYVHRSCADEIRDNEMCDKMNEGTL